MPVILDDAMLIPPSMRRKNYHLDRERIIEIDSSSSTIEIPRQPPSLSHGHRPVIVHEEYAVERPPTEIITEREIIIDPGSRGVRRYRGPEYRRGRAQSLSGYDSFSETSSAYDDSEYYYLEDGTRHRHPRRGGVGEGLVSGLAAGGIARDRQRRYHDTRPRQSGDPHKFRHMAEGAVIGGAVEHLRHRRRRSSSTSSTSSDESDHRLRNLAGAGVAAAGAKVLYDRHRAHEREGRTVIVEDRDRHRHIRHLAEAGAGLAAAGVAKGLYDHHRRNRSRSSSSSRSRSRSRSRVGRHLAATALGATAAGVAAHKLQRRRRGSWSSYSSSDDDSHRGRKVLAGAATAAAAGIAAKRLASRHRSRSSSASSDDSSHKLRNTALLGAAALAARHHHKKKERARSRSMSRPGILRRRSRTYSPPRRSALRHRSLSRHRSPRRHRSSSRGAALAKAAAVTMAGALANKQQHRRRSRSRARSADAAAERRRRHMRGERRVHYHNDPHIYNGGSSASTVHPGESVSQAGGPGGRIRNAIMPAESHGRRSRRGSMAQDFAYKVGESVAEGLRRM